MWWWVAARAKAGVTPEAIVMKRKQWVAQGKERHLQNTCRAAQRYVVEGSSPAQVFWLVEANDSSAVQVIADHFSELWDLETHVVIPQPLADAVNTTRGGG